MKLSSMRTGIILLEAAGFLAVVVVMWLDELLDLPHNLFGVEATPSIGWKGSSRP